MADRPIIFSVPEIRALISGAKSQTRRIFVPPAPYAQGDDITVELAVGRVKSRFEIGDRLWVREACFAEELSRPEERRSATRRERQVLGRTSVIVCDDLDGTDGVRYAADDIWIKIENTPAAAEAWSVLFHYRGRGEGPVGNKVPPIHMPRWASRLTLTVTDVRVERLQEISEADVRAEGIVPLARDSKINGGHIRGWGLAGEGGFGRHLARDAYHDVWNNIHGPDSWAANPWVCALTFAVERGNIDTLAVPSPAP